MTSLLHPTIAIASLYIISMQYLHLFVMIEQLSLQQLVHILKISHLHKNLLLLRCIGAQLFVFLLHLHIGLLEPPILGQESG
jgi:hypothetical protein